MPTMEPVMRTKNPVQAAQESLHSAALAVLADWAGLQAQAGGAPKLRPTRDRVCLGIALGSPRPGLVALAATHRLGARLAVAATGDPGAGSFSGEALVEFCQLLRERLRPESDGARLRLAAQVLDPDQWPGQAPLATLTLMIDDLTLELWQWEP